MAIGDNHNEQCCVKNLKCYWITRLSLLNLEIFHSPWAGWCVFELSEFLDLYLNQYARAHTKFVTMRLKCLCSRTQNSWLPSCKHVRFVPSFEKYRKYSDFRLSTYFRYYYLWCDGFSINLHLHLHCIVAVSLDWGHKSIIVHRVSASSFFF